MPNRNFEDQVKRGDGFTPLLTYHWLIAYTGALLVYFTQNNQQEMSWLSWSWFFGLFNMLWFCISYYFLVFVTCVMVSKFRPMLKFLGYSLCNSFILLFSREFIFSCVIKLILNFVELIPLCLLLFGVWVYSLMSFELFPILPCSLHVSVLFFFFVLFSYVCL